MERTRLRSLVSVVGIVAVVVSFGGISFAIALSPAFGVTENALSNLGVAESPAGTETTALVFNGGLIVGGALGALFGIGLAVLSTHPVERIGSVLFAVSMLSMGGVGVFPQDQAFHFEVAAGFYLLFSLAVLIFGAGQLLTGDRRGGAFSIAAGVGNLAVWIGWGVTGSVTRQGLAIPELLGAAMVVLWVLVTIKQFTGDDQSTTPQPFVWEN